MLEKKSKPHHHSEISGEIYVSKQPFFQMLLCTHTDYLNTIRANTATKKQLYAPKIKEKVTLPFLFFARDTKPAASYTEELRSDQ